MESFYRPAREKTTPIPHPAKNAHRSSRVSNLPFGTG